MRKILLAWALVATSALLFPAGAGELASPNSFDARSLDSLNATSAADLFVRAAVSTGDEPRPVQFRTLHAAAFYDMVEWAGALLDRGLDVNIRDDLGRTPLMIAAAFGSDRVAALLLARGSDPKSRDSVRGDTALHYAALTGHKEVARLLLAAHVDVAIRATHNGETPLHYAALRGHLDMIELLVGSGVDVNVTDNTGVRPLQYAKLRLRAAAAELLDQLGARPDSLADAVNAGDVAQVQAILASGVDVDEPDLFGTGLHRAAAIGRVYIAGMLINHGADVEAAGDMFAEHPLHVAALHNQAALATLLLDQGAAVDVPDSHGRTALTIAAEFGNPEVAAVLLARGADPNAQQVGLCASAPIHFAARAGNIAIVRMLLSRGVDIDSHFGGDGASPLITAALWNKTDMIAFLLAHGADPDVRDGRGQTALDIATSVITGRAPVAELLRQVVKN